MTSSKDGTRRVYFKELVPYLAESTTLTSEQVDYSTTSIPREGNRREISMTLR